MSELALASPEEIVGAIRTVEHVRYALDEAPRSLVTEDHGDGGHTAWNIAEHVITEGGSPAEHPAFNQVVTYQLEDVIPRWNKRRVDPRMRGGALSEELSWLGRPDKDFRPYAFGNETHNQEVLRLAEKISLAATRVALERISLVSVDEHGDRQHNPGVLEAGAYFSANIETLLDRSVYNLLHKHNRPDLNTPWVQSRTVELLTERASVYRFVEVLADSEGTSVHGIDAAPYIGKTALEIWWDVLEADLKQVPDLRQPPGLRISAD